MRTSQPQGLPSVVTATQFLADEKLIEFESSLQSTQDLAGPVDQESTLPLAMAAISQPGRILDP